MGKNKKERRKPAVPKTDNFGHEIWGLIFLAIATFIIISLVSHFINKTSNILGYYFGTALSQGLIYIFGPICAFLFPCAVGLLGWQRFRGEMINIRQFFFGTLLTMETCLLLAIPHLPDIASGAKITTSSNIIGFSIVSFIEPVFDRHTFGPYFIASLTLLVTALSAFRISPQRIIAFSKTILSRCIVFLQEQWRIQQEKQAAHRERQAILLAEKMQRREEKKRLKEAQKRSDEEKNRKKTEPSPVNEKASDVRVTVKAPVKPPVSSPTTMKNTHNDESTDTTNALSTVKDISAIEDEARQRLEVELAAFRAKRSDPIKIMAIETEEVETDSEQESDYDGIDDIEDDIQEEMFTIAPEEYTDPSMSNRRSTSTKPYVVPDPSILSDPPPLSSLIDKQSIEQNSMTLEKTLMNFGVEGKVVFVSPGPVVTRYEIELAPGVKVSKVLNLHDDLSMAVGGQRIRIEAPIPGKSAVGIELPNAERQIVHFKHILLADAFKKTKAKLPVVIGSNVSGAPYVTDVTKMPHVLIAGQTGSGKSVCINSLICSLLMTMKPDDLRLIMIDPKKVELAFYEGIPHLLSPVVTESKEAVKALQWGVIEMERRYRVLAKVGARNIDSFNGRVGSEKFTEILPEEDNKKLPFIVIIVDELADLMMTASKDVEVLIQRIAQLARAVGIHLIVATQRPSVDIITGPIKANLTSRIGFRTIQSTDSRTILGHVGAEKLLGLGDMLFLRNGAPEIERFHGAFISEEDVEKIVDTIRSQHIEIEKINSFIEATGGSEDESNEIFADGDRDELFEEAARTIVSIGQGSTSLLQRRMKIGYARAGRLMDELERAGFVGPPDGSKAREVFVKPDEIDELLVRLR